MNIAGGFGVTRPKPPRPVADSGPGPRRARHNYKP